MKELVLVLLVVVSFQYSYSQTNPKYSYKLDIKTKFADKKGLEPLKNGLIAKIENSVYFKKVEFGENYSLWIKTPEVQKEIQPDGSKKVRYYCLLELRTAAAFTDGKYVSSRAVPVEYIVSKEILDKIADPEYKNVGLLIAEIGENMTDKTKRGETLNMASNAAGVQTLGISKLGEATLNNTCQIMSNYFKPKDPLDFKAEYVFVGTALYDKLIEMIVELENR